MAIGAELLPGRTLANTPQPHPLPSLPATQRGLMGLLAGWVAGARPRTWSPQSTVCPRPCARVYQSLAVLMGGRSSWPCCLRPFLPPPRRSLHLLLALDPRPRPSDLSWASCSQTPVSCSTVPGGSHVCSFTEKKPAQHSRKVTRTRAGSSGREPLASLSGRIFVFY